MLTELVSNVTLLVVINSEMEEGKNEKIKEKEIARDFTLSRIARGGAQK